MAGATGRTRVRAGAGLAVVALVVIALAVAVTLLVTSGDGGRSVRTAPRVGVSTSTTTDAPATTSTSATSTTSAPGGPTGELAALRIADPQPDGYDRDRFGDWIDDDGDCRDTRAEVLAAESRVAVTYTTAAACTVATGEWLDPWSGSVTTSARALDVDHTVPLANAWRSGAWAWTPEQRRAYANDVTDAGHLIAIPLGENRSKGDAGPEDWKPPAPSSWCAYAQLWASIKARWDLSATPAEWAALQEMAATC